MKKFTAVLLVVAFCYGCGSETVEKKPIFLSVNPQIGAATSTTIDTSSAAGDSKPVAAAPAKDGKVLLEGADCRACHQDKTKLVGPAYADVAKKYKEADIPKLAKKVIDGGTGVWGQIPMAPHPNLSTEDVEAMVKYILTIK
ncbi:MAG: c-type cytochrome [Agriterribacter sp.]